MTQSILEVTRRMFSSLRIRNFRLFFIGQFVSMTGTWLQAVAQAWLVLRLSNNGFAVGAVTGLQFLPTLLLSPWAGLLADRVDKHKAVIATQASMAVVSAVLTVVTATGVVELWMVYVAVTLFGLATVIDTPMRQSFVYEMVGKEALPNAIGLNSAMFNGARMIGPAVAGVLIVTVGIWPCFLVNTVSFVAVIAALRAMRVEELRRAAPAPRARGQVREGLLYVWQSRERRTLVTAVAVVSLTALNFQVVLPLLTRFTFDADARAFGAMSAVVGAGSLVGALVGAARARPSKRLLVSACGVGGVAFLALAASPTITFAMAALVPLGAGVMLFMVSVNALLQLGSEAHMRGRVMSLYALVFGGVTPIGSPAVGWLAEEWGVRTAVVVGGVGMLLATAMLFREFGWSNEGGERGARRLRRGRRGPAVVVGPEPLEPAAV